VTPACNRAGPANPVRRTAIRSHPPAPPRMLRLFLVLLALPAVGAAQTASVTGRVLDAETGQPLPMATVALFAGDSLATGATTALDGTFRVDADGGTYDVHVSFVGYDEVRREGVAVRGATDLGAISLAPGAALLGEVRVAAERTQREDRIDRTVYRTADTPATEGGSATDVLATIPSVDVDVDGNISLRGSGGVAVFINGRPAPVSGEFVAAYLASLPAGAIERVEVIPNPSAAFEPDGVGGILNIVLRQDADPGLGGTVTAGATDRGGATASATVTLGRGPWSVAATYGFRRDARVGSGTSYRLNRYEATPTTLDQREDEDRSGLSNNLTLSVERALSRATTLTTQAQLGVGTDDETERSLALRSDAGVPLSEIERLSTEGETGRSGELRLGLRHRFGEGHELTVGARGEASREEERESYSETRLAGGGELDTPQRVRTDGDERGVSLQADYTRPLGALTLDAGYLGEVERQDATLFSESADATGAFVPDVGLNNAFVFDESVHAVYAQASGRWGRWGLQAGLRGEVARTSFDLTTTGEAFRTDYESLFPSAFLAYSPTEALTLRGGYSRRINRPGAWSLNPFPSFDDPLNVRQGNPALRPEYVDAVELAATQITGFGSVAVTPYYRRTTDVIRRIAVVRPDGVTVRTSQNLDTADAWGAEGVVSLEGRVLRGFVSLEGYRLQTEGATTETSLSNDAFGWGGRANLSVRLGDRFGVGDLDLQTTARYSAPITTEQGRVGARTYVDLALRQKLLGDRASLTLQARDPLGLAGFSFVLDQPELYQESERDWGLRQVTLTFSYTFGRESARRDRQGSEGGGGEARGEEF